MTKRELAQQIQRVEGHVPNQYTTDKLMRMSVAELEAELDRAYAEKRCRTNDRKPQGAQTLWRRY
jgi:hypothetical protein